MTRRLLALSLLAFATPVAALDVVGKAAAVRREANGTPPGEAERALTGGLELYSRERVVTSSTGDVQVLFRDESTLSIGPGSDLVLDEFVYDPGRTEDSLSIKLERGITRLIGGRVTKEQGAQIHTPNATIAIRGGIVIVSTAEGTTQGTLGLGTMTCTGAGGSVVVTTPGMMCIVAGGIEIRRASSDEIGALLASLVGKGPWDGERTFDAKAILEGLALDCGGEASIDDPRCLAVQGFAGVDPEPLGGPRDAEKAASLVDQLQEPLGNVPSPPSTGEKIHDACCPD